MSDVVEHLRNAHRRMKESSEFDFEVRCLNHMCDLFGVPRGRGDDGDYRFRDWEPFRTFPIHLEASGHRANGRDLLDPEHKAYHHYLDYAEMRGWNRCGMVFPPSNGRLNHAFVIHNWSELEMKNERIRISVWKGERASMVIVAELFVSMLEVIKGSRWSP